MKIAQSCETEIMMIMKLQIENSTRIPSGALGKITHRLERHTSGTQHRLEHCTDWNTAKMTAVGVKDMTLSSTFAKVF